MHHHSKYGHNYQVGKPLGLDKRDIASLENALPALFADALTLSQQQPRADAGGRKADAAPAIQVSAPDLNNAPGYSNEREYALKCDGELAQVAVCLRCDPETARISAALHKAAQCRLWTILRELSRQSHHMAFTKDEIRAALKSYGVKFTERTLSRWLRTGHGLYWNIDSGAGLIYPASPVLVAQRLIDYCKTFKLYDLYVTNYPGQRRDMLIDVSGDTRQYERRVYEAWFASRNNPAISRYVLTRLWNCDEGRLYRLERDTDSRLTIGTNYAFCDLEHAEYTPFDENGERRKDVKRVKIDNRYVWQWQISNSYYAPVVKQHAKRGVSRRVSYTLHQQYPELQATGSCEAREETLGSLNRSFRMFYSSYDRARASAKSNGDHIRYVLLGRDDDHRAIFEVTPDGRERLEYWGCYGTLLRNVSRVCVPESEHPF